MCVCVCVCVCVLRERERECVCAVCVCVCVYTAHTIFPIHLAHQPTHTHIHPRTHPCTITQHVSELNQEEKEKK